MNQNIQKLLQIKVSILTGTVTVRFVKESTSLVEEFLILLPHVCCPAASVRLQEPATLRRPDDQVRRPDQTSRPDQTTRSDQATRSDVQIRPDVQTRLKCHRCRSDTLNIQKWKLNIRLLGKGNSPDRHSCLETSDSLTVVNVTHCTDE